MYHKIDELIENVNIVYEVGEYYLIFIKLYWKCQKYAFIRFSPPHLSLI